MDVLVYGNNIFLGTRLSPIQDVINLNSRWANKGYIYFNWIISRFTDNPHVFYGLLTFIFTLLVFVLFRKYNKELNVPFAMLMFLFILWPVHLNILRQGLSIALTGFVLYFFCKDKIIYGILFTFLAFYMHDSSIIISIIYFFLSVFCKKYFNSEKSKIGILSFVIMFSGLVFIPVILKYFPNIITAFAAKYYYVVSSITFTSFSYGRFILFLLPAIIFYSKVKNSENYSFKINYIICLINSIFNGFAGVNYVLFGRLSYYFYLPLVIFIAQAIYSIDDKTEKTIFYVLFFVYSIFMFIGMYALGNYGNLFPYTIG